jgi:hypothetical protein
MTFPAYRDIDLTTTPLKWGYYVPGLIEQYRPDIELISIQLDLTEILNEQGYIKQPHHNFDYSWLPEKIDQALDQGLRVGLLVEDEHVAFSPNQQLINIVNRYCDQPVYWLTQFDQDRINRHYVGTHGIQCKILELPWVILNECLMYNSVKQHRVPTIVSRGSSHHNKFFTLTGRYEPFRKRLLEKLIEHRLDCHGLLTVQNTPGNDHAYNLGDRVTVEPHYPYSDQPIKTHAKMAAQFEQNNHWVSCNTQNFLHIERTYLRYPLAIIPETCPFNYFATEKSVWPVLLGKLFLIFGSAGCMQYIQRFYDVDISKFLNLEFDRVDIYTDQDIDRKLDLMLRYNKDFILNAHRVYDQYRDQLQAARNTLGPNLYRFVQEQVSRIQ